MKIARVWIRVGRRNTRCASIAHICVIEGRP
jgi:hypothetical protein